jgi:IS4 transposase
MQTDILVFRESTGQLITERSGLSESDLKHSKVIGRLQQDGNGNFSYTIAIRSTEDTAASKRKMLNLRWQDWQAASQMNPELHVHKSDPGYFLNNWLLQHGCEVQNTFDKTE